MPLAPPRPPRHLLGAVVLAVALTGCSPASGSPDASIRVRDVRIELPPDPSTAAVRFTIENDTGSADRLIGVASPVAGSVSVHRSSVTAGGLATMTPVRSLVLPARSSVRFEPGGLHVMLSGLRRPLRVGDRVPLTLRFAEDGSVRVVARVVPAGSEEVHDHAG